LSIAIFYTGFPKLILIPNIIVYDESKGIPDEGIEPGTLWADVPDDWTCPVCGSGKEDFDMVEI